MTKWIIIFHSGNPAEGWLYDHIYNSKEDAQAVADSQGYEHLILSIKVKAPRQHPVGSFAHFQSLGQ